MSCMAWVCRWEQAERLCFAGGNALLWLCAVAQAQCPLPVISGRHLLISPDEAFQLRGFAYSPTPIGQFLSTSLFTDARFIHRDGTNMTAACANTIRIYGGVVVETNGQWTIGVSRAFLRAAASNGLWVVVGSQVPANMDFADQETRQAVVAAHVALVASVRDEPNILMWAIGNEVDGTITNSSALQHWYSLVDEVAAAIKQQQGGGAGPGSGPYVTCVNGDLNTNLAKKLIVPGDSVVPNVDIWSINAYRGPTFGTLFSEVKAATTKPFWIAETGIDSYDERFGVEDQAAQARYATALWEQVTAHRDIVIGADLAFFSDEWWKDTNGSPTNHDPGGSGFGNGPDNFINEEWLGACAVQTNASGTDDIIPKEAYREIQRLWVGSRPWILPGAPEPLISRYDARDANTNSFNNYGGYCWPNCGPGVGPASVHADAIGASGQPGDHALHARVTHPASVPFSYFGVVETLFPEQRTNTAGITGIDWSGFDTLAFDAKVSTNTATNQWAVRLEDTDFTNEWNNVGVSLPPLTTTFQPVSIAMSQFLNGGDQTVDLSRVAQVVFQVAISNGHSSFDPLIIDLVIDNLHVYSSTSSAAPFRAGIGHRPLPGGRTEFTVTFPATNDVIHEVQFRESLSTGGWSGLPGSPHDRGCANDNAPATTRFYRVVRSTP